MTVASSLAKRGSIMRMGRGLSTRPVDGGTPANHARRPTVRAWALRMLRSGVWRIWLECGLPTCYAPYTKQSIRIVPPIRRAIQARLRMAADRGGRSVGGWVACPASLRGIAGQTEGGVNLVSRPSSLRSIGCAEWLHAGQGRLTAMIAESFAGSALIGLAVLWFAIGGIRWLLQGLLDPGERRPWCITDRRRANRPTADAPARRAPKATVYHK
jgi:hypothetical protein